MSFRVTFTSPPAFTATFSGGDGFSVEFENTIEIPLAEFYPGPYEVTPTNETQILYTEGLAGARNITISPIPKNYGLITRTGAVLTVS